MFGDRLSDPSLGSALDPLLVAVALLHFLRDFLAITVITPLLLVRTYVQNVGLYATEP